MNRGGTETMLMNHYRALDRTQVQFDFLVHYPDKGDYDDEIKSLGGRIFHAPAIRPWTYPAYFAWLDKFFKEHASEYCAVHGHIQENTGFALRYAKKYGIENRLSSSHIATSRLDYKYIFRLYAQIYLNKNVTTRLACGVDAGRHLYGRKNFTVFKNAVSTEKFIYNPDIRKKKRDELGIDENTFLIGNVGRFCPQKNHSFIIRLFADYAKTNPDARLALAGTGPLMQNMIELAGELNISDKILFLGSRSDVNELLQAFDLFFMPSLYEGLPVSVVEAQAADLPCLLADTIDKQTDISGNCSFLSLKAPVESWFQKFETARSHKRRDRRQTIIAAGYDVANNLKILLPLYGINAE